MSDADRIAGRPPFRGRSGLGGDGKPDAGRAGGDGEPGAFRGSFRAEDRRAEAPDSLPEAPDCPFCDGVETELMSAFGAHASVCTYWCRSCRSPFELMRWR